MSSESQEDLSQVQPIAAHAMTGLPPVLDQSNQPTNQIDAIAKLEPTSSSALTIPNSDFSRSNIKRSFPEEEEEENLTDIINSTVNLITPTHKRGNFRLSPKKIIKKFVFLIGNLYSGRIQIATNIGISMPFLFEP